MQNLLFKFKFFLIMHIVLKSLMWILVNFNFIFYFILILSKLKLDFSLTVIH